MCIPYKQVDESIQGHSTTTEVWSGLCQRELACIPYSCRKGSMHGIGCICTLGKLVL